MQKAKIAELKNNLSRYLGYVREGGTVLVFDRDRPIARIIPLQRGGRGADEDEAHLAELERRGVLRRGTGKLPGWLGRRKPPRVPGSVLQDLLDERESGW